MATISIGLRNRQLRALQCTVRDRKRRARAPAVHVVTWPRPSGVKVSIGILCPMQNVLGCTAMSHPTVHCPHRRNFQVIFRSRDGGKLGDFPLQHMLLIE